SCPQSAPEECLEPRVWRPRPEDRCPGLPARQLARDVSSRGCRSPPGSLGLLMSTARLPGKGGQGRPARASASVKPSSRSVSADGTGMVEQAYRIIRQRILDNVYPAGYRALEREFAEALQLSRTPVREALLLLQAEG